MTCVADVTRFLEELAPPTLAESWDNVGLLVGDAARSVTAVMTCLTLTEEVAREAVEKGAGLVVSHHPLLFRPVQRITADNPEGRALLGMIEAGVAVYSPHTSYDNAIEGINQQLAEKLGLTGISPLRRAASGLTPENSPAGETAGGGRCGDLEAAISLSEFVSTVKKRLGLAHAQYVDSARGTVRRVGVACGSAAEFLPDASLQMCDVLVTGEARFHAALEARALGVGLVLIGHYASERPGVERLAEQIAGRFGDLRVWASHAEKDPIHWS